MASSLIRFESSRVKAREREAVDEARAILLKKAEDKAKVRLERRAKEDNWMLPALDEKIHKKKKKEKKKKQKKKKKKKLSSSSSSSDEDEWVEKKAADDDPEPPPPPAAATAAAAAPPSAQLVRDEWMNFGALATVNQADRRSEREAAKERDRAAKRLRDAPGRSARELNPYFRDGGDGMPKEPPAAAAADAGSAGGADSAAWLRRAYARAREQAEREGRTLEEVAAARWGSLEKFQRLLKSAEAGASGGGGADAPGKPSERAERVRAYRRDSAAAADDELGSRSRSRDGESCGLRRRGVDDGARGEPSKRRHRRRSSSSSSRSPSSSSSGPCHSSWRKNGDKARRGGDDRPDEARSARPAFRRPDVDAGGDGSAAAPDPLNRSSGGGGSWKTSDRRDEDRRKAARASEAARKEKERAAAEERRRKRRSSSSSSSSDGGAGEGHRAETPSSAAGRAGDEREASVAAEAAAAAAEEEERPAEPAEILSEVEMNAIGAKIVKAELLGNSDLAAQLKSKLAAARAARQAHAASGGGGGEGEGVAPREEVVVLTRTDSKGMTRPVEACASRGAAAGGQRRKKTKVATHEDKERVRYFADDDKYDLKQMFEREKLSTSEDQNAMMARLAGRAVEKTNDDYDIDDIFVGRAAKKDDDERDKERDRDRAIAEHRRLSRTLDDCRFCVTSAQKHLMVAIGAHCYVALPPYVSLTAGHCLIVPRAHVSASTLLDEDVWAEMQDFRKALAAMFAADERDCVFFESALRLKSFPHMVLECVPLPREEGDMAPMYFQKAIQESESEWSHNKKLISLREKSVRRAVPKGLPYFHVDFGLQDGFAHVIEEEPQWSANFAQEIIGGMLDLDPSFWRHPKKESFEAQKKKVIAFGGTWKDFDFTSAASASGGEVVAGGGGGGKRRRRAEKEPSSSSSSSEAG